MKTTEVVTVATGLTRLYDIRYGVWAYLTVCGELEPVEIEALRTSLSEALDDLHRMVT